jgi:hypothetical protein
VYLPGGPSHLETFDMKPDAPAEIRGQFKPISTNLPGVHICEHLPRLAQMMDKVTVIRSLADAVDDHSSNYCLSGYPKRISTRDGGRPGLGAIIAKFQGAVDPAMPPNICLTERTYHRPYSDPGSPGYLGLKYAPFTPSGPDLANMTLARGVSWDRLGDRKSLLRSFDHLRRDLDTEGMIEGTDAFTQRAFEILTSTKVAEALDVSREDPRLRAKYGHGSPKQIDDAGPRYNDQFLMARRLVEAGARCVSLAFGSWDMHGGIFPRYDQQTRMLDQALTALIEDLHARGLDQDVTVLCWGEFGRTPRINSSAGRDHWAPVGHALLACGGMRAGQVIGSTNRLGERPKDRPLKFHNVFATLYHNLGIDPSQTIVNRAGRPMYLLDDREPIPELVG